MFPEQLKKILNLVKKTGDRVIIFDAANPDDSYVIMGFDSYADQLVGDQAERSVFKAKMTGEKVIETTPLKSEIAVKQEKNENLTEEDLTDKINREISMWKNRDDSAYLEEENKPKKAWQIPSQVKDKAQEVQS